MSYPAILTDVNTNPIPQEQDNAGNWQAAKAQATALLAAGTASASATDANIPTTNGFTHISITNDDATNSITFAIDETSAAGVTKPIVLKAGEKFDDYIKGTALHYSASSGSPSFRYVIR